MIWQRRQDDRAANFYQSLELGVVAFPIASVSGGILGSFSPKAAATASMIFRSGKISHT
jgi:hypothetical protein